MVTGIRDELALASTISTNDDDELNGEYQGTGQGIRLQYSQKMNCVERSYFGN